MSVEGVLMPLLFGYPVPPEMVDPRFPLFLQRSTGLLLTLEITVLSLAFGTLVGMALALLRRGAGSGRGVLWVMLRLVGAGAIEGLRALPIAVLVLVTFHLPYRLFGLAAPETVLAVVAFSLYAGAYLAEVFRAGWRVHGAELRDGGRVLGLTRRQILLRLELPLVWRHMMPDIIGIAITVFKDSATLAIVAVPELTYVGRQMLTGAPGDYALVMFLILFLYWLPATLLSAVAFGAERRRVRLEVHA